MKGLRVQRVVIVALLSFAGLHGVIFWRVHDFIFRGYGDFAAFYTAGKMVQQGEGRRLYDRGRQWEVQQGFAGTVKIRRGALPYIRPPFEALLFEPLAHLKYAAALLVWTGVKVVVLWVVLFWLRQEMAADWGWLANPWLQGVLCLGFFPVAFDLLQGQDAILLLLVLTLFFRSLERGWGFRSGMYLGLGLFKFHLIVPLFVVLLLKRRGRAVVGFCSMALVLLLISAAVVGWSGLVAYPRYLWDLNRVSAHVGINSGVMPNIRGLLTPFIGPLRVPLPIQVALLGISFAGIAIMARSWRIAGDRDVSRMGFSFCIVVILVTSYYTTAHDLTLLILPLLLTGRLFVRDSVIRGWPRTLFLASAALLLCSPLYWLLLSVNEFFGIALVLLTLAISLAASLKVWGRVCFG
jgi:hypothetical protein